MNHDEWTAEEQARLRAARIDGVPPRGLEETTVLALRERGLVRRPQRRMMVVAALAALAGALAAAAGWSVTHRAVAPPASPRFVLLLYAGTDPVAGTPDTRRREYSQWARDVSAGGTAISGEELSEDAREVAAPAGGPQGGAPPGVPLPRGFFVVSAPDLDAAERIASTCPHLRYGGRIVIKRVV